MYVCFVKSIINCWGNKYTSTITMNNIQLELVVCYTNVC